ncbi:MAG: 5-formyltetrahydrofolate cyclo-ligase [Candidatus Bathyarchaeia archaeon]
MPDFEGSEKCAEKIRCMSIYRDAGLLMITPDNNLARLRELCILDGKTYIMPTYSIARGFLKISREQVPEGKEDFASTLDGADRFSKMITLSEISSLKVDLVVTGCSIINLDGVRYGKGHGYFDLEWAMLREVGAVDEGTPIIVVAHDCQLVNEPIPRTEFDTIVDVIITPTREVKVKKKYKKPKGIIWERLEPSMFDLVPPLKELKEIIREKGGR